LATLASATGTRARLKSRRTSARTIISCESTEAVGLGLHPIAPSSVMRATATR
jgi:hypothetical protein